MHPFISISFLISGHWKTRAWLSRCWLHKGHITGPLPPLKFSQNLSILTLHLNSTLFSLTLVWSLVKYCWISSLLYAKLSSFEWVAFFSCRHLRAYSVALTFTFLLKASLDLLTKEENEESISKSARSCFTVSVQSPLHGLFHLVMKKECSIPWFSLVNIVWR